MQDITTIIYANLLDACIEFYTLASKVKGSVAYESVPIKSKDFCDDFFAEFRTAVAKYGEKHPDLQSGQTRLVVPDNIVAQDTISVPTVKKALTGNALMENLLKVKTESLYKNHNELKINTFVASHNRQLTQFALSVMRKDWHNALTSACNDGKMPLKSITTASAAAISAVSGLRPKYKNANYLLLDIKESYARYVFGVKERAAGSFVVPFGYKSLSSTRMPQEDMLFNHSLGEIVVLNAKEKAKQKALTMMGADLSLVAENAEENGQNPDGDEFGTEPLATANAAAQTQNQKFFVKKTARKLPKFMQRETPDTADGYVYENFRIFIKWALTLIQRNREILQQGKPEFVLVNVPEKYESVFENAKKESLGTTSIEFVDFQAKTEKNPLITDHLELFGCAALTRNNTVNVF